MENFEAHVYLPDSDDKEYFVYIFNPNKDIVYNAIRLLIKDETMAKNSIATLDNFWIRDNKTIHSFIIKDDRTIIGLVVGNIRTVSSPIAADYNIFNARLMEVNPLYSKKFRDLTSEVLFETNKKYDIKAIIGTDCGYNDTSNTLAFWIRPIRVKKNQKLGNFRIVDPKKYLPKTEYMGKTEWILHDGKHNLADIMNWYLYQRKITFVRYNPLDASALVGKNIKVYHSPYFDKIFAFLEQPHDHKSCLIFYMHGVNPEEIALFLYQNTKYEHMILVIPGAIKKEIVMSIIDDIRAKIYFKNAEVCNQILVNPHTEKIDLVSVGSELLSNIF